MCCSIRFEDLELAYFYIIKWSPSVQVRINPFCHRHHRLPCYCILNQTAKLWWATNAFFTEITGWETLCAIRWSSREPFAPSYDNYSNWLPKKVYFQEFFYRLRRARLWYKDLCRFRLCISRYTEYENH